MAFVSWDTHTTKMQELFGNGGRDINLDVQR